MQAICVYPVIIQVIIIPARCQLKNAYETEVLNSPLVVYGCLTSPNFQQVARIGREFLSSCFHIIFFAPAKMTLGQKFRCIIAGPFDWMTGQ